MKEKILKILDILIPCVTAVCVAGAGFYIYSVRKNYNAAENEYSELSQLASDDLDYAPLDEVEEDTGEEENVEKFHNPHIRFDVLEEINPDVVGWISIPDIQLNYPVLQGKDNNYYLHHTFRDEPNSAGSIFLDSAVADDMSSRNTFIYGHAMKNGTMFGTLKQFNGNDELLDKAYIYYYTKDHAYRYKIFANYITKAGSVTYHLSDDKDQLDFYLTKIEKINRYEKGKQTDLTDVQYIITLSTCSGVSGSGKRTVIQAYLDEEYGY